MINFMKEVHKVLRVYKVCVCRLGLWMVIPEKKKWGNDIRSASWDFPGSPVVKTSPANAVGENLIPGEGAGTQHV